MSKCHLCDLCHYYGGWFNGYALCNAPDASKLMDALKAFDYGRDDPRRICKHFVPKEES